MKNSVQASVWAIACAQTNKQTSKHLNTLINQIALKIAAVVVVGICNENLHATADAAAAVITVIIGSFAVYWSVEEIQWEPVNRDNGKQVECPTTTISI